MKYCCCLRTLILEEKLGEISRYRIFYFSLLRNWINWNKNIGIYTGLKCLEYMNWMTEIQDTNTRYILKGNLILDFNGLVTIKLAKWFYMLVGADGNKSGQWSCLLVTWQNHSDRYCKKADVVNMKDDQTKSEWVQEVLEKRYN